VRNPHGYISSGRLERDTVQCAHCGCHVIMQPGKSEAEKRQVALSWCGRCSAVICAKCEARGLCDPFEAQLKRAEDHDRFLRQLPGGP